ncbi:6-phosphogluconolactonase [Amphibacillus marinus]|uniref:6-phosphogluconolactonase n=1 Tax=Amphibacillus marinus TaxID=872970 RepID=A0A1H8IEK9_9BACI|nr:lactonase family protein [Amphibacillus marinus]SEN66692.1 6-phosphogluconolactonase [Amphibacillus marinus]
MTKQLHGYIGTYTKAESEGVYKFTLDLNEKKLVNVTSVAVLDNPTYVTMTNDQKYLYAVAKEGDQGGVTAFAVDAHTKQLTKLNSLTLPGSPPCHVSVASDNRTIVTANYHTKQIVAYVTNEDGSLKEISDVAEHDGSGPHERQDKPHMHYAGFSPDERFVIAVDLGSDEITTYALSAGKLIRKHVFKTPAGSGPRHISFAPNSAYAYVMTELTSEVLTLKYDQETGAFALLGTIKAIPDEHTTVNDGSAIHISADGKFVYVANRGHNSIAVFQINDQTHLLEFVEWTSTEGDWPRDFILTPDDQYLIATNQKTGTLTLFERNKKTGKLTAVQTDVVAPESVCIKILG